MTYTPQTWVDNNASYPLSAARMNYIEAGIEDAADVADQGHLIFTNEAARDAAITSPVHGQMVYLTAPTGTTNTDGCLTLYNGSVWLTLTPQSAMVTTLESTTNAQTTYVDLATSGPSVSLVTGTKALVTLSCLQKKFMDNYQTFMSFAVSGATTIAADDANAIHDITTRGSATDQHYHTMSRTFMLTGLTAGTNTFTCKYKDTSASTTGSWGNRSITIVAIP